MVLPWELVPFTDCVLCIKGAAVLVLSVRLKAKELC